MENNCEITILKYKLIIISFGLPHYRFYGSSSALNGQKLEEKKQNKNLVHKIRINAKKYPYDNLMKRFLTGYNVRKNVF